MPDTNLQQRVDIRPAPWRMVLLVLGIAVFTIVGFFMMTASDDIVERAAGLLAIIFFGGIGSYALYRMWRGQGKLVLSPAGLEITMFSERPVVVPWGDIETIGVLKLANQELTTIRLKSYRALLAGLTAAEEQAFLRGFAALRYIGHATAAVAVANEDEPDDIMEALAGTEKAEGLAGHLALARAKYGAEILLPWNMRDRGAQAFADYLEQWRGTHS